MSMLSTQIVISTKNVPKMKELCQGYLARGATELVDRYELFAYEDTGTVHIDLWFREEDSDLQAEENLLRISDELKKFSREYPA